MLQPDLAVCSEKGEEKSSQFSYRFPKKYTLKQSSSTSSRDNNIQSPMDFCHREEHLHGLTDVHLGTGCKISLLWLATCFHTNCRKSVFSGSLSVPAQKIVWTWTKFNKTGLTGTEVWPHNSFTTTSHNADRQHTNVCIFLQKKNSQRFKTTPFWWPVFWNSHIEK